MNASVVCSAACLELGISLISDWKVALIGPIALEVATLGSSVPLSYRVGANSRIDEGYAGEDDGDLEMVLNFVILVGREQTENWKGSILTVGHVEGVRGGDKKRVESPPSGGGRAIGLDDSSGVLSLPVLLAETRGQSRTIVGRGDVGVCKVGNLLATGRKVVALNWTNRVDQGSDVNRKLG